MSAITDCPPTYTLDLLYLTLLFVMGNITSCNGTSFLDDNTTSYNDYNGHLTAIENDRKTMLYVILPSALLGIALNVLCLVFFLRRERKGIGNQILIGLVTSDLLVCISSPTILLFPINNQILGAKLFDLLAFVCYIFTVEFMTTLWYPPYDPITLPHEPITPPYNDLIIKQTDYHFT